MFFGSSGIHRLFHLEVSKDGWSIQKLLPLLGNPTPCFSRRKKSGNDIGRARSAATVIEVRLIQRNHQSQRLSGGGPAASAGTGSNALQQQSSEWASRS